MSNDMEQIEARLAGYVDGTLAPDQKAEIEAYLAANPGHGRLIAELRSIKSAVANLPREKAPAEIMDGVQSHLERAQLLDGVEDHTAPTRINPWPQLGAVAAVLLLMAGLGLLVYQVLPRERVESQGLALLPATTRAGEPDLSEGPITLEEPATRPADAASRAAAQQTSALRAPAAGAGPDRLAAASPAPSAPPGAVQKQSAFAKSDAEQAAMSPAAGLARTTAPGPHERADARVAADVVRIEVADPMLARNLVAMSFAGSGRVVASPTTGPSTAPATAPIDGVMATADLSAAADTVSLTLTGLRDDERAEVAAVAAGRAPATRPEPATAPATGPARTTVFLFVPRSRATTTPATDASTRPVP